MTSVFHRATNSYHGYFHRLWRICKPSIATVCRTYFYADNLAISSTVTDHVQHASRNLEMHCSGINLNVGVDKTKNIKLRNDGSLQREIDSRTRV